MPDNINDQVHNKHMKSILIISLFIIVPASYAQEYPEYGVRVETVADNLSVPWSIDFAPDGRAFFTERGGTVWVIQNQSKPQPITSFDVSDGEGGLLGITLDPQFEQNHFVYLYFTYNDFFEIKNKVVRYLESENTLIEDMVLVEPFIGASYHDGGRIRFGPDGKLYITTGDAGFPAMSQNKDSVVGKILRINSDGTIPEDNPFRTQVYSFGHRNPQGIDWDKNGMMFSTEHGPSGWRGIAHDEINKIISGGNYGWPEIIGDEIGKDMIKPILHSGQETWAPSGSTFYYGEKIPQWTGKFFVATLRGEHLHMISFDEGKISSHEKLFEGEFGRLRDVVESPEGDIYLLTSNKDGRGNPFPNDDKILKIIPINTINNVEECIDVGTVIESHPRQCTTQDGLHFIEGISQVPSWIKQIAKWWSSEEISDGEFLSGFEYLINNNIIRVPPYVVAEKEPESEIPLWLRKNVDKWVQGLTSDEEFLKNIKWMIENNFIKT